MGPSKEVVTANGTEEGGPGGVSCASMEKGQLLHFSCEIIGIFRSCLGDHVRTARVALHCVMQRDHVEFTGGVLITCSFLVTCMVAGPKWTVQPWAQSLGTETSGRWTLLNL